METSYKKKCCKSLDNASLTGYRVLLIFKMLLEGPCDDDKINERFKSEPLLCKSLSTDTVYIYMNTLRAIGCEITRPCKSNNFKYILLSHPFGLSLNVEELNNLQLIAKNITSLDDWRLMININNLIKTISSSMPKEDLELIDVTLNSVLPNFDTDLINSIEKYCHDKRTIVLEYNSPESGPKLMEVIADNLSYENGNLYLWGYNLKCDEIQYLRVDRIKSIKIVNLNRHNYEEKLLMVRYKLMGNAASVFVPERDEKIVKKTAEFLLVEAKIKNTFRFIQRILTYGSECIILSPEKIRNEVVTKLKSMMKVYEQLEIDQ